MLVVHFVKFTTADSFKKTLFVLAIEVRHILKWVIKVHIPTAKKI